MYEEEIHDGSFVQTDVLVYRKLSTGTIWLSGLLFKDCIAQ